MQAPDRPSADAVAEGLHSAAIHLLRRVRKQDDASGLTAPRLSALSVVVYRGPLSLGALAAAEQVRPPTMSAIARELEAAGLIERQSDPRDGRAVLLRATPAGERLLHEGRRRRTAWLARQLASLPPDELATLTRAVELIAGLLEQADGTSPGSTAR
jgi:DNA-binding MarR family transcriptional regulator